MLKNIICQKKIFLEVKMFKMNYRPLFVSLIVAADKPNYITLFTKIRSNAKNLISPKNTKKMDKNAIFH